VGAGMFEEARSVMFYAIDITSRKMLTISARVLR
jgi:hypothetical protein